jgi:hypothetical protein
MSLAPEYALLLDATVPLERARVHHRDWDGRRWGETLRLADWHRLSPILFTHVRTSDDIPGAVHSALERAYLANAARALFLADRLSLVLQGLAGAGIRAMLLKGAALVETAYPDPAEREMLDLDVLVPDDRLAAATRALADLGYTPDRAEDGADGSSLRLGAEAHHDAPLVDGEHLVAVELHRHIAIAGEGSRFKLDGLWERSRPSHAGTHRLPSPEDLLLHVCLHFTRNRLGGSYRRRHTGGALAQVCDMGRLIDREPLAWPSLVGAARDYGLSTRVFLALFAARQLGVPVPDDALAELEPSGFNRQLGRDLVALRVLRAGDHLPDRTLRWMFAPGREVLSRGWNADSTATLSLARAYVRRARAQVPLARSTLRRPWSYVQDQRLNGRVQSLEEKS